MVSLDSSLKQSSFSSDLSFDIFGENPDISELFDQSTKWRTSLKNKPWVPLRRSDIDPRQVEVYLKKIDSRYHQVLRKFFCPDVINLNFGFFRKPSVLN